MNPPTVKRPSSNEEPDPESRPVATDFDNDPLQSFAPENRQDGQPSVGLIAPTAAAKARLFDPQAIAGFGVFVDAINDVEKHLEQHLAAVERHVAALDERNKHNEERLTAFETIVAETRANVRALDDSIETRVAAKETRVAQQEATSYRVDSHPSRAPRQPKWSGRQSLLAVGVVAVAVLALVGIVTMRSRGDVNQTAARTTAPLPPAPAPMITSTATPLVPAAPPDPAPAILTASAVPAASPVPTAAPVKLPTAAPVKLPAAAPADPPRPRRVAAPKNNQVATPQTERPANREQARPTPPQRPIRATRSVSRNTGCSIGSRRCRRFPERPGGRQTDAAEAARGARRQLRAARRARGIPALDDVGARARRQADEYQCEA